MQSFFERIVSFSASSYFSFSKCDWLSFLEISHERFLSRELRPSDSSPCSLHYSYVCVLARCGRPRSLGVWHSPRKIWVLLPASVTIAFWRWTSAVGAFYTFGTVQTQFENSLIFLLSNQCIAQRSGCWTRRVVTNTQRIPLRLKFFGDTPTEVVGGRTVGVQLDS